MALWQIASYRTALDTELQVRRAITLLRARYGRRWRRHAPADLVWMLRTGVDVGEACDQVRALVDVEDDVDAVTTIVRSRGGAPESKHGASELRTHVPASHTSEVRTDDLPLCGNEVDGRLEEALQLNRRHWIETGRPISAETLRKRLHISASASRDLTRVIRAADATAILSMAPQT
jgi:hypothetical protein